MWYANVLFFLDYYCKGEQTIVAFPSELILYHGPQEV
jgi:hypothetical protein